MAIEIAKFTVDAVPHPERDDDSLRWLICVRVKFRSDDPADWGELRAYGGSWMRTINRTVVKTGQRDETKSQVVSPDDLSHLTDIEDSGLKLQATKNLPPWPGYMPTFDRSLRDKDLRLGNDQHIEIFYAKQVPLVPRSCPTTKDARDPKYIDYDPMIDTMAYDDIATAERPHEIDTTFHIFGRDEPERSHAMKAGDYCEYYHAAEFHIRPPRKTNVLARKKLLLIIRGEYGKVRYLPPQIT